MTTEQSTEQTDNTSETCEPGSLTTEPTKEIVKMRKPVKTSTKKKRIYRPTTTKATESTIVVDHTKKIGRMKKPLRTPIKKKNIPGQIATNATESTIAVDPSKKIFRMRKPVRTPIKKKNTQRRTTTKATEPTTELTSEPTTELTNEPIIELTTGPTIELANEPTIELTTEPTTMTVSTSNPSLTVIEQFRMLQNQLFRGVIDKEERPKIIKALMRLKYALQGRVVHENATIVKRRSNLRKGLHRL
ncbi:hypothetical protein B5X24_HaOG204370 [Helicoverpa armigera]|uniref:Uncharacterized protein n=1 Tax=Helicoverpa armigera TaxID=29058 RepID=A0A2W1BNG3_HELAM|nr:hypothetical protein B5X24_HaOG204370 [Helicoverpa armigera]